MRMKTVPTRRRRARAEPQAPEPIVQTIGLTKRYGDFVAVDRLDLDVRPGEIFGLLGPNGAGKTTTILMILGLSEPSDGKVRVAGLDPTRDPLAVKRRVGYLPDNVGFYGALTGRQNLRYTARLNGMGGPDAEARIDAVLADVRLEDRADDRVETYSRGMRQRLGIADALVKNPVLLILDEPTIAIDPAGVAELLGLIRALVDERSLAVLLSSHLLEQVQSICDRVGIFVAGRLVTQGRVGELAQTIQGGPATLELGVAGDRDAVEGLLRDVPGVTDVTADPIDRERWLVTSETDVRGEIVSRLTAAGLTVLHLRRRGDDLDTIYRRFVSRNGEGDDGRVH